MTKPTALETNLLPRDDVFVRWSERLQKSDHRAFSDMYKAMFSPLLRYAWRYTRDKKTAEDVVQDAFTKLWQIRESVDPKRSLKALLYTMVRNLALNTQRAADYTNGMLPEHGVPDPSPSPDDLVQANMLDALLRRFIDELPRRRREAFTLSRYEGLSHREIAQVMDLTPRTVNTHIVLALKDIRKRLGVHQADQSP